MSDIISNIPITKIDTDTIVEIESKLPDTQLDVTKSITVEIQPENYVLTSGGIYTGNMTGSVPTWILNAIQQQLTTGDGNITSVLDDIKLLLDGLQVGVNQAISRIENTNTSMSALETSVVSRLNGNDAAILDVYATRVTATEAQAVAVQAIGSTFNGNVDAYIGNLASTYTDANSATAINIRTLQASYNEQTARIDTVEYVKSGLFPEWDGISTPNVGEYKEVNGIFYTYVGGTLGEFSDGWMRSTSSPYTYTDSFIQFLEDSTGLLLEELKNQIDGVIDSWYYSYVPDQSKEPWSTWIALDTTNGNTNEQIRHSGDLFYDLSTGIAYRFALSEGVFGWSTVTDTIITLALKNASTAQYTADGKASVYYSETIPVAKIVNGTPIPIKIGDLWVQISTGITKVAVIDNPTTLGNWGNVSNSAAENALLGLSDLEEARDGVVVVYYLTTTTAATGMTYGDYLVDTDSWNGSIYNVYRYENTSGGSSGTLSWRINTGELSKTLSVGYRAQVTSNTAQNTADSKSQIIYSVTAPTLGTHPLLDIGDQWVNTTIGVVQVWNGTSWVDTTNKGAIDARNGILHNAVLASPPTATGKNDIWVVTDRWYNDNGTVVTISGPTGKLGKYKNLVKVWDGTAWIQKTLAETQSLGVSWVGGASKLLYGPDGGITGWEFADGNGLQSEFKINAQKFSISDGTTGYTPFSITGSDINFLGKVSFSSVTGAPGGSGNLLYNSAPALGNEKEGWQIGWYNTNIVPVLGTGYDPWRPSGGGSVYATIPGAPTIGGLFDVTQTNKVPVVGGSWYDASAYTSSHRCTSYVTIAWFDSNDTYINKVGGSQVAIAGGGALINWGRTMLFAQAPANAAKASFYVRSIVNGTDPYCFVAFAYLGKSVVEQTVHSDWSEGSSAGSTIINGNRIATGSVAADRLGANIGEIGILYNIGGSSGNYTMKIDLNAGEIHIK